MEVAEKRQAGTWQTFGLENIRKGSQILMSLPSYSFAFSYYG
jgi:hypothetical protein